VAGRRFAANALPCNGPVCDTGRVRRRWSQDQAIGGYGEEPFSVSSNPIWDQVNLDVVQDIAALLIN
jgi:hypothetical protein